MAEPPSTGGATPTTKLAAGLHSHGTGSATSSALPEAADRQLLHDLSHGLGLAIEHTGDHGSLDDAGTDGVDTDTPRAYSTAADLVRPVTPCLEAW